MHPHFYHWLTHAHLKPDKSLIESWWNAAASFAEDISDTEICSLLHLVLFTGGETEFAKKFAAKLVELEPSFPPTANAELLRVMATAAVYSQMVKGTVEADTIALGLYAAAFPAERVQPICKEVLERAGEYLVSESERMRPAPHLEGDFQALKKATETEGWQADAGATKLVGDALVELGDTMGRIAEENQFLWWLVGRQSPLLKQRRGNLAPRDYALVAAVEAADRVTSLPPPASVEFLLNEVMAQCEKDSDSPMLLVEALGNPSAELVKAGKADDAVNHLMPITGVLAILRAGYNVDATTLKPLNLSAKTKASPAGAARQYFRELMFLRALEQIS